jgi:DNA polymerase-3 subunit gamma/tau
MLGLADRGRIFDLLEEVLRGQAGPALSGLAALYRDGADPVQSLADIAEAVHAAARIRAAGADAASDELSAEEKRRAANIAQASSPALLARAWQMLLKGIEEAAAAPNPLAAAEMVLIRLAYTADLPTPDEIIRRLGTGRSGSAPLPASAEPDRRHAQASAADTGSLTADREHVALEPDGADPEQPGLFAVPPANADPRSFADVIALAGARRDARLKVHLEEHVSLVKFDPAGSIELHLLPGAPGEIANELREKLNAWTGRRWIVALSYAAGARPVGEMEREREAAELEAVKRHPAVQAVLQHFPGAEIKTVRKVPSPPADDSATGS